MLSILPQISHIPSITHDHEQPGRSNEESMSKPRHEDDESKMSMNRKLLEQIRKRKLALSRLVTPCHLYVILSSVCHRHRLLSHNRTQRPQRGKISTTDNPAFRHIRMHRRNAPMMPRTPPCPCLDVRDIVRDVCQRHPQPPLPTTAETEGVGV
jgi:hypothetical protein